MPYLPVKTRTAPLSGMATLAALLGREGFDSDFHYNVPSLHVSWKPKEEVSGAWEVAATQTPATVRIAELLGDERDIGNGRTHFCVETVDALDRIASALEELVEHQK